MKFMSEKEIIEILEIERNKSYGYKMQWSICINQYKAMPRDKIELANEGIERYLSTCFRTDILIDAAPIKEIIMDALTGRQVWKETDRQFLDAVETESETDFRKRMRIKSTTN